MFLSETNDPEETLEFFLEKVEMECGSIPEEERDDIYSRVLNIEGSSLTYAMMDMLGVSFVDYLSRDNYKALYKHFIKHPEYLSDHRTIKNFCKLFDYAPHACDIIFHLKSNLADLEIDEEGEDNSAEEEEEEVASSEEEEEY
jgi:hypothetical protein